MDACCPDYKAPERDGNANQHSLMQEIDVSETDPKAAARVAGLNRLTESDLRLLAKSLDANRALVQRLPKDLHWSEEIAPVLRLANKGERGQ